MKQSYHEIQYPRWSNNIEKHSNQIRFETQNKLLEFQLAENHDKTETNPTK